MLGLLEKRRIEKKGKFLHREYMDILAKCFPGVVTLPQFLNVFGTKFPNYQETNKQKLNPSSIREGYTSCSSAAALLGIWWEMNNLGTPVFLLEDHTKKSIAKTRAHVVLALLASMPPISSVEADFLISQSNSPVKLVHYEIYNHSSSPKKGKLKIIPATRRTHKLEKIKSTRIGSKAFLENRVVTLGLPKGVS